MIRFVSFIIAGIFFHAALYAKTLEIEFWHSFSGSAADAMRVIVQNFNASASPYSIRLVYKGEYTDALTSFVSAFRAKKAPMIMQVFEVGTSSMLTPPGIIKPLATLLEEEGIRLPEEDFFAAVRAFYSVDGKLQALPFTISIPVIFYNASLLKKWGIDAENFPRSEETLEKLFENIKAAGFDCAYTSAYPSWVHIESYSAMHGLFSTSEAIFKHIIKLKEWQQQGYLQYAGRRNEATSLFTSGHCPLFSQSLGAYRSLQLTVPFEVGVALFPLDEAISQKRYNLVPGGAALWVVQGHPKEVYRGIALFFQFLATPVVQAYWFSHTGYLPLGVEGGYRSLQNGKGAALLLLASQALAYAKENRGPYSGPQQQIRTLYDEALEMIFSGMVSSQKAWDEANLRASYVLMRFFRNRQG